MPSRIARLAVPSSTTLLIIMFISMATCRVIEHGHLVGTDRHRWRVGERRADAGLARGLADHGAADLRVALAERDRELHRDDVDGAGDRLRERHRAGMAATVVLGAPVSDAHRRIDDDRGRLEAV